MTPALESSEEFPLDDEEPGITFDRVVFHYDAGPILQDVSWELNAGSSIVITGQNGCGKSSFLYLAAGLIQPHRGAVLLGGFPVKGMLPSERLRRGLPIGFVFQEGGLLANLNALANLTLPLHYHADILQLSPDDVQARAEEALHRVQIHRRDWGQLPAHLSFGNRKRLAIARALVLRPRFFFFDDPDAGMDQRTAKITHDILCDLR
ncbi:MAG: ATP-binding cassette domain-containing protein, partial [Polyangiaceae bacterium]|nr:ATP-binding cassette domain-containing protein [Polyangiaceae bacterium]